MNVLAFPLPVQEPDTTLILDVEVRGASAEAQKSSVLKSFLRAARESVSEMWIDILDFDPKKKLFTLHMVEKTESPCKNSAIADRQPMPPLGFYVCGTEEPLLALVQQKSSPIRRGKGYFCLAF